MNLDVRRIWECPICRNQVRRNGDVACCRCHCQDPPVWMHLVEGQRPGREYQPYIVPEVGADELFEADDAGGAVPVAESPAVENDVGDVNENAAPTNTEHPPADAEDFYSPDEETEPMTDQPAPVAEEPMASASAEKPTASAPEPQETKSAEQPRRGKSRRRRSGRKRNRKQDPQKG